MNDDDDDDDDDDAACASWYIGVLRNVLSFVQTWQWQHPHNMEFPGIPIDLKGFKTAKLDGWLFDIGNRWNVASLDTPYIMGTHHPHEFRGYNPYF